MHTFGGRYSNSSLPPLDKKQQLTDFQISNFEVDD